MVLKEGHEIIELFDWFNWSQYNHGAMMELINVTIYFHYLFAFNFGIIHLVRKQNFPKNQPFLLPDTHTYVCVSGGKKC